MRTLLIVFHSQSGLAQQLALRCYQSAIELLVDTEQVDIRMRRCMDADIDDVLSASLVLFIMPENFAAIAGGMKDFLDRVFYPAERAGVQLLPYALLVAAGNDGSHCLKQMDKILLGINGKPIQMPHIVYTNSGLLSEDDNLHCQTLAQTLVLGLDMGLY